LLLFINTQIFIKMIKHIFYQITFLLALINLYSNEKIELIIPSYNVEDYCERTIQSIINQDYQDFTVHYIDDGSSDNTYLKVTNYIKKFPLELQEKFNVYRFENHKGSVERLYESISKCEDDRKIVFFEGNCSFLKKDSLTKISNSLDPKKIWLIYGQSQEHLSKKREKTKKFSSKNLFTNSMRGKNFKRARIKAFYAGLFKKVAIKDFFFRSKFIDENFDIAYMFPMMEMAREKTLFFSEALCEYSKKHDLLDLKRSCSKSPIKCKRQIVNIKPYRKAKTYKLKKYKNQNVDIIVFSYNRPIQLYAFLESAYKYILGFNKIEVIYRSDNKAFSLAYNDVKRNFPNVHFVKQSLSPFSDFKPIVNRTIFSLQNTANYIAFAVDDIIVKDYIDLQNCIKLLKQTSAYFFSLRLGKNIDYCYMANSKQNIPFHVDIEKDMLAWKIDSAQGDWFDQNSVDMTIYKKKDIKKSFNKINFKNPTELEINWNSYINTKKRNKSHIGLSYNVSKCINIPINIVFQSQNRHMNLFSPEELLSKYNQGLKIDIDMYHQFENCSVHMDSVPRFIDRPLKSRK
jgi:glycosyltransferase involved in cell wall biosynthesis